jgi:hypothetical protein
VSNPSSSIELPSARSIAGYSSNRSEKHLEAAVDLIMRRVNPFISQHISQSYCLVDFTSIFYSPKWSWICPTHVAIFYWPTHVDIKLPQLLSGDCIQSIYTAGVLDCRSERVVVFPAFPPFKVDGTTHRAESWSISGRIGKHTTIMYL